MNISTLSINIDIRTPSEKELYEIAQAEKITTVKLESIIEALRPYFRVTPDPVRAPAPTPLEERLRWSASLLPETYTGQASLMLEAATALRSARAPEPEPRETGAPTLEERVEWYRWLEEDVAKGEVVRDEYRRVNPGRAALRLWDHIARFGDSRELGFPNREASVGLGKAVYDLYATFAAALRAPESSAAPREPEGPHAGREGLREVLERVEQMGAQAQAEAEIPGDPEVGKAWSGGYAQACRHILGDLRALLHSPASEAPAAPDAQEVRKLVRKAFCAGYLANGPTNPFEMEEKADRYTAVVCDPPRLDRIIRPTGALSARPAESEVRDGE